MAGLTDDADEQIIPATQSEFLRPLLPSKDGPDKAR